MYSFGVLLCEICIWELPDPYRRDEQVAMVTNRVLRDLIRRCLQQDANVRPRMEDIIGELEQCKISFEKICFLSILAIEKKKKHKNLLSKMACVN